MLDIWREVLGRSDIGVADDFFDLDGDSLSAIRVIARIRDTWGVSVRALDFFESPTVATLAAAVATAAPAGQAEVTRRPADAEPVLSYDQQRLWLEDQLLPGAAYHVHGRQRLIGPLDTAALDTGIRAIVTRHEILRTRFPTVDGQPVQVVDELADDWHIRIEDLGDMAGDRDAAAAELMDAEALAPFDLARGPLVRCLLVRVGESEHYLGITAHHIVCDDWSVALFGREVAALYGAGGDLARSGLEPLDIQYRDYAYWQRSRLTGDVLDREVGYWREQLAGAPPAITLPARLWGAPATTPHGGRVVKVMSKEDTEAVHQLCRGHGVTVFMTLLAGLATVLGRWSGQWDLVIGVPITGRSDAGTQKLIGFFVNTLPLRVDLTGDPTFADLLERARQAAVNGYAHADAPLDVVVGKLAPPRMPGRTPLFQVMLNVVDSPSGAEPLSGVSAEALDAPARPSKFDLTLTAREWHGALHLDLEFDADRYAQPMVEVLLGQLGTLLREVARDPVRAISTYAVADAASATGRPDAAGDVASGRLDRFPERAAVVGTDGSWTYGRLDAAADRVARTLAERLPNGAEGRLGVVWRPTGSFIAVVLGCLRAGASFTLLDPAAGATQLPGVSVVLDVSPSAAILGATLDLRAILDDAAAGSAPEPGDDRITVLSTRTDHLMSALADAFHAGAAVLLPETSAAGDPAALLDWLRDASVTVAYLTPPVLRALGSGDRSVPSLRLVLVDNAGDFTGADVAAVRSLSATARCVGLYRVGQDGHPTAAYAVPSGWSPEAAPLRVPLGSPVRGHVDIQRPTGQPAAVGEVGEIRFDGHRTGDLGRIWTDGTVEFVPRQEDGATDRVEIASALRALPGVVDAMVEECPGADGDIERIGYVGCPGGTLDAAEIRQQLLARLPENMIPEHIFVLDRLPLTGAGDYELGALPHPDADSAPLDSYLAPRTPLENQLTGILEELLGVEQIGVHDSFFELGGFSLLATQLASRVRESIRVELSLRDIFESATVEVLAQLIVRAQAAQARVEDVEALLAEIEAGTAQS